MPYLNIKRKIILYHFLLVFILVAGLGYHQYKNQIQSHINSAIQYHEASSSSLVSKFSQAISGQNYANIQMPSFIAELKRNRKLNAIRIVGISNSNHSFKMIYNTVTNEIWREEYPEDYLNDIQSKIDALKNRLEQPTNIDQVKINFLIERNKEKLQRYKKNRLLAKNNAKLIESFKSQKAPFADLNSNKLFISIATSNKNGGSVEIIFDISEIKDIKFNILKDILYESVLALTLSLFILTILSIQITSPINKLQNYISQPHKKHNLSDIPCIERNDEMGCLAKTLQQLLEEKQRYESQLKKLSRKDPLTGLGNRRDLESVFSKGQMGEKVYTTLLYIDIDNFKKYNDNYGHNMGDQVLQKVAKSIDASLQRKGDYAFRVGGEEFVVLISIPNIEEIKSLAERIRENIQDLAIEHELNSPTNVVTTSIGAYLKKIEPEEDRAEVLLDMLNKADANLYTAKNKGRNCVIISHQETD